MMVLVKTKQTSFAGRWVSPTGLQGSTIVQEQTLGTTPWTTSYVPLTLKTLTTARALQSTSASLSPVASFVVALQLLQQPKPQKLLSANRDTSKFPSDTRCTQYSIKKKYGELPV